MPKDLKRDKHRRRPKPAQAGQGGGLVRASARSRTIHKDQKLAQHVLPGETEEDRQDLFQMLFVDSDTRKLERALITFASISLEPTLA